MMYVEIYEKKPEGFVAHVEVAACYLEVEGKVLLLQNAEDKKREAGKFGIPAGKMELQENAKSCALRELLEETGIRVASSDLLRSLGTLYFRKPAVEYVFHIFHLALKKFPEVILSPEHQGFIWAAREDEEALPLMGGAKEALEYCRAQQKKRTGAFVNAYLILREDNRVLLHLRQNTGYNDGLWGFVAGHVEDGESATAALVREAKEEIGIAVQPSDLKVVHVAHRKTNRQNVDVFFECRRWSGTIENLEPEKCAKLEFFPWGDLPENVIEDNAEAFAAAAQGLFYSEKGW